MLHHLSPLPRVTGEHVRSVEVLRIVSAPSRRPPRGVRTPPNDRNIEVRGGTVCDVRARDGPFRTEFRAHTVYPRLKPGAAVGGAPLGS